MISSLQQLSFDDRFVREMPADPEPRNFTRQVSGACFSFVEPTPVAQPRLLAWSTSLAAELGVTMPAEDSADLAVLAGNALAPGMRPYAARYGGHQFGHWAGQLGDGRAITLGEQLLANGRRFEWQLKGAGVTPYSRHADGRAVLRSSLREFVCSEAMHALGVPTTRALSLVGTGEAVVRDMFYDGRPQAEPGAIVCRIAPSFIRFGNFEIHSALGEHELLRRLADHVIRAHHPELDLQSPMVYSEWFETVCVRTAQLMAHWMRVGFVHGVMNTDNLSILGLTIDYGPYGWLENYDPTWTPNTTDLPGRRYAYGQQPQVALWNLSRLAGALLPLFADPEPLHAALARYRVVYAATFKEMLAAKLGLASLDRVGDEALVDDLFALFARAETDMTIFFRGLAEGQGLDPVRAALYDPQTLEAVELAAAWREWLQRRQERLRLEPMEPALRVARMQAVNPCYVPRNYLAQLAIDAATVGDLAPLQRWLQVLREPYREQVGQAQFAAPRPEWARTRPGCSALSCSS